MSTTVTLSDLSPLYHCLNIPYYTPYNIYNIYWSNHRYIETDMVWEGSYVRKKWIEGSEFGTNAICHNIWEREKKRDVPKLTSYEYRIDSAECKTLKSTKNRLKTEKLILSWFCRIFPDISFSNLGENRLLKNCERDMRMEKPGAKQLKRLKKVRTVIFEIFIRWTQSSLGN